MNAPSNKTLERRIGETSWRGPANFARLAGITLRSYQSEAVKAIIRSIIRRDGKSFVVVFPRQSGKNEVQAHLLSWLMFRYAHLGGRVVSVSPTFKPQTINSMDRVRASLERNPITRGDFRGASGFIFKYKQSRLQFFSADPSAKVVGATADLLLSVDEAQDVDAGKFDKDFDPMTASTNATRVFWGTVWTSDTLLSRQMQIAKREQEADGEKRLFFYTADDIRKIVPAYGLHVDRVIAEKGRQHPLVKTQYFCEQIDSMTGMFPAGRLALMQADGRAPDQPQDGKIYAMTVDVAGMDEALLNLDGMGNPGRDSTAVSILEVDLSQLGTLQAPIYRVVKRFAWQGVSHMVTFGKLAALIAIWRPLYIAIDATGVGEGLWAMLDKANPARVIPVKFTQQSKSEIGYGFIAAIETGRFRDLVPTDEARIQYEKCTSEVLPGPAKTMRWGVKDGTRHQGQLIHDDIVLADSLIAELDKLPWIVTSPTLMTEARDVLKDMDRSY